MTARTYTPIFWDAAAGRTQLLAYLHDLGTGQDAAPGSHWAAGLTVGTQYRVFGPRRSLDLSDPGSGWPMGLGDARVIDRQAGDTHLAVAETELTRLAARRIRFALTGKASSIQRMSRALKTIGVPAARIRAKAYWAPGKTGLD